MPEITPTLVINRVTKKFGDFTAVRDLSLQVRPGRVFGLIGPNGAGKTTTIRMIVNITVPDSGSIELFGQKMSTPLQDRIGYLPEERGLYRKMKIGEQLRFFAELKNVRGKDAEDRINRWLAKDLDSAWRRQSEQQTVTGATAVDGTRLRIIHNWSFTPSSFALPAAVRDVLSDDTVEAGETIRLGAWDVRVLAEL